MRKAIEIGKFFLQFFPLSVFLRVAFQNGTPQAIDWLNAFIWGGAVACLQLAISHFISRGRPLNRIILGVNFYLILGGIAVLTNQLSFLEELNNLKESGIFLCMLMVGFFTTIASKSGYVGVVKVPLPNRLRFYSVCLLLLTCAAVLASFWFRGNMLFSAAIPLIILSIANRLFKRRLERNPAISNVRAE